MITRYNIHVTKLNTKSSIAHVSFHSILFWCWAPTKALLLLLLLFFAWINSINSIIRNYGIWSTLISKHFKIKRSMKKMKKSLPKRKMATKILLIMEPWNLKRLSRWKAWVIWNYLKIRIYPTIHKVEFRKFIFKIKEEGMIWESTWPKNEPCIGGQYRKYGLL